MEIYYICETDGAYTKEEAWINLLYAQSWTRMRLMH